jgi:hypothetical protein
VRYVATGNLYACLLPLPPNFLPRMRYDFKVLFLAGGSPNSTKKGLSDRKENVLQPKFLAHITPIFGAQITRQQLLFLTFHNNPPPHAFTFRHRILSTHKFRHSTATPPHARLHILPPPPPPPPLPHYPSTLPTVQTAAYSETTIGVERL